MEQLDVSLLQAGTEAIRQWRQENPGEAIQAQRVAVADLDLSGADLSGANLTGGKFVRCNFSHVSFARANLVTAEFEGCVLDDVEFRGADLKGAKITAQSLNGAQFGGSRSLGRLASLRIVDRLERSIDVDRSQIPWYDRWLGWDRLRFLSTVRIFVPAYASLTLTILYINSAAWINAASAYFNSQILLAGRGPEVGFFPVLTPNWIHGLVLANFFCLAMAATCFLSCPARVVEFSRERWLNELKQPELLYDHEAWQRPLIRALCASSLLVGGLMSTFLLGRAIVKQIAFIMYHIG